VPGDEAQSVSAMQPLTTVNVFVALALDAMASAPMPDVAIAETLCEPRVRSLASVSCHPPFAAAVVAPTGAPSMLTATFVRPGAVPEISGRFAFVMEASAGELITGCAKTHTVATQVPPVAQSVEAKQLTHVWSLGRQMPATAPQSALVIQATMVNVCVTAALRTASGATPSVATAVTVCVPCAKSTAGVKLHAPVASLSVLPARMPSNETETIEVAAATPVTSGRTAVSEAWSAGAVSTSGVMTHAFAVQVAPLGQSLETRQRTHT
jgi:hypothetical protein